MLHYCHFDDVFLLVTVVAVSSGLVLQPFSGSKSPVALSHLILVAEEAVEVVAVCLRQRNQQRTEKMNLIDRLGLYLVLMIKRKA